MEFSDVSAKRTIVLNLGSGLDTLAGAFLRSPDLSLQWYDADLPTLNRLKQNCRPFCDWNPQRFSIVDLDLLQPQAISTALPYLSQKNDHLILLLQGVLMYLKPAHVHDLFKCIQLISKNQAMTTLIFDWCSPLLTRFSRLHPGLLRARITNAPFEWSVRQTQDITDVLIDFHQILTEDPIYPYIGFGAKTLKMMHDRLCSASSGIYGCTVLRHINTG